MSNRNDADNLMVEKANGEQEPFMKVKLENSLYRAGASEELANEIVNVIRDELSAKEGDKAQPVASTKEIYDRAYQLLSKKKGASAARYALREAMMELGPTGFPFEQFIGRLFRTQGYKTGIGVQLQGQCIEHEVDVVAYTDSELHMMEAKFHNERGITSDVQDALYVKARFDDLATQRFQKYPDIDLDQGWLVTNTKFSSSAIEYGECAGLKLVGWNYPASGNLQHLIEEAELQPITCLSTLPQRVKSELLKNDVVLCSALSTNADALRDIGMDEEEILKAQSEAKAVCG